MEHWPAQLSPCKNFYWSIFFPIFTWREQNPYQLPNRFCYVWKSHELVLTERYMNKLKGECGASWIYPSRQPKSCANICCFHDILLNLRYSSTLNFFNFGKCLKSSARPMFTSERTKIELHNGDLMRTKTFHSFQKCNGWLLCHFRKIRGCICINTIPDFCSIVLCSFRPSR